MAFHNREALRVCLAVIAAASAVTGVALAQTPPPTTSGGQAPAQTPPAQSQPAQPPAGQTQAAPSQSTQQPGKPQAEQTVTETREEPALFKARVNLVMVPVVVRDSKGKTVAGLTKADFQLFDKGKPQVITRFSQEKAGAQNIKFAEDADGVGSSAASRAAQAEAPQRFLAYVFDDIHASFGDLVLARKAAINHVSTQLTPTDRAGLFTTSGVGVVDFTSDRDQLIQAINDLRPRPIVMHPPNDCPTLNFYMADMIVNKNDQAALAAAVQELIQCQNLSGPAIASAPDMVRGYAQVTMSSGEQESHVTYEVLKDLLRRMSATPGQRIVVLASPGFWTNDNLRSEETDIMDRAIRNNVTINAIDIRGLWTDPSFDASRRVNSAAAQRTVSQYLNWAMQAEGDTLAEIAHATGGQFFHNNNSMDEGFRVTATAPQTYYILGFSPQNLRLDGSYHSLKVTLAKTSGHYDLQARNGYYSPKRLADAAETAKEEIQEAIFSREELKELPIDLHTQFFKANNGMANLTVMAHLDVKHFHYNKANDRNNNTVTIVSSLFDRNGNIVSAITKTLEMHLKDETLEKKLDNGLTVRTAFSVKPGTYIVRLVVRDTEAQQISAQNGAVDIP